MIIDNLQVNHLINPIGYSFEKLLFSWRIDEAQGDFIKSGTLHIYIDQLEIYKGSIALKENNKEVSIALLPTTRYFWNVELYSDSGEYAQSEKGFFETGKMKQPWQSKWLVTKNETNSAIFENYFAFDKKVEKARIYICGLGLYELYVNGKKQGNEYLLPGYHSYDKILEYQTFDITKDIRAVDGKSHIEILLGNGWYKGRFVFDGGFENIYGNRLKTIAELHVEYVDGSKDLFVTDESWSCHTSYIDKNNIYDGEVQDYTKEKYELEFYTEDDKGLLKERSSVPICEVETIFPKETIITPKGDTILDFGEMITGWVSFFCKEKKDTIVKLLYGEWMQEGELYRDNLRTAKAEFYYKSRGEELFVRPHFTFYGFRYVKVEGISSISDSDFKANRIRSNCGKNIEVKTGNELVNRLIQNAYASQECNFLDIPTDCPQRDERMGWTGDIGIFSDAACFNMDCHSFLEHYLKMLSLEQTKNGSIPFVVPFPKIVDREGANPFFIMPATCGWGDVCTVLPWTMYCHFKDKRILEKSYPMMQKWISYIKSRTVENGTPYLWQKDFQLGDWLALDSIHPMGLFGLTDTGLIASAYYYHSTEIAKKSAEILGHINDVQAYQKNLLEIKAAFKKEFFDKNGELLVPKTQTSYAIILEFGLCPDEYKNQAIKNLVKLIDDNNGHISTGFIGTPLLLNALSENGQHEIACNLLLKEDYPGWLYEIKLGAISMWERWNSVSQDGKLAENGMNSLNHYAFGSLTAWIYRYLCGFKPKSDDKNVLEISPLPCPQLKFIEGTYHTSAGVYRIKWEITKKSVKYSIEVPFNGSAIVKIGNKKMYLNKGTYVFFEDVNYDC